MEFNSKKLDVWVKKAGRTHHDHLCCLGYSKIIEVVNPRIETLRDEMCAAYQFKPLNHRLQIYGYSEACEPV